MQLFPYQETGVAHLIKPELKHLYLADDPGMGKTMQATTAAKRLGARKILVVCPASIVDKWQKELRGFPQPTVVSYESLAQSPPKVKKGDDAFFIPEKESVVKRKLKAQLQRKALRDAGPYDVLILDEAHFLKERTSNRTNYLFNPKYGLINYTSKTFLLSGTPVLNRPSELYPVLRACYPEALFDCPNFQAYSYKFCAGDDSGFNGARDDSGSSNEAELSKRLMPFMLRRTTEILGDKLPPLKIINRPFDIEVVLDKENHVATRRRETGEAKIDQLLDEIEELSVTHNRLVIFYYHDSVRTPLVRRFPLAPVIKGGLTSFQKEQMIQRFTQLNVSRAMIVQLGAGGVGLDGLQHAASAAYVAELDWTPALMDQAIGRVWRLGQKNPVTIYKPIGRKQGLDGQISRMLDEKEEVIRSILHSTVNNSIDIIESLKDELNMLNPEQLNQLLYSVESIAASLQVIADNHLGGSQANDEPKPKRMRKAASDEPVIATQAEEPPAKIEEEYTHKMANAELVAELNSNPELTEHKNSLLTSAKERGGYEKVSDVPLDKLRGFVNSLLVEMSIPPRKQARIASGDL